MISHSVTQASATIGEVTPVKQTRRNVPRLPDAWKAQIEAAREAQGLSRNEAAKKAGVTGASYHRMMNDRGSWDTARRVSKLFGVPLPQLAVDEGDMVGQLQILGRLLAQHGAEQQLADLVEVARAQVDAIEKLAKARKRS